MLCALGESSALTYVATYVKAHFGQAKTHRNATPSYVKALSMKLRDKSSLGNSCGCNNYMMHEYFRQTKHHNYMRNLKENVDARKGL